MSAEFPSHLDLLFSAEVVSLKDETWGRVIHASSKSLGRARFKGGILVGDPFSCGMDAAQWPGEGPMPSTAEVRALVADCGDAGERVCALALHFDETAVARWVHCAAEVATDCGIGGFMSAELEHLLDDEEESEELLQEFEDHDAGWTGVILERQEQSLALASSGYGDGAYGAWWGVSAAGQTVCLAIDFDILSEGVYTEARLPLPLRRGTLPAPGLPGVRIQAGLFSRARPKILAAGLPVGHYVYARIADAEGTVHAPKITFGLRGVMRLDLRCFSAPATLIVRLVTGKKPMDIVSE